MLLKYAVSDVAHGVVSGVLSVPSDGISHASTSSTTAAAQGAITLRTVDFGGQREYLYTHPLVCTSRAVYAVCAPLDKLFDKPPAEVVNTLREYASMVQVRAPEAPMVVVFTQADQVPGMTPDAMPAAATRWIHDVMTALRAEFSQIAADLGDDSLTCSALVLSSKDGWEASQVRVRDHWVHVAMASPGAGDTLPASYGKMREALGVAGAAWKDTSDHGMAAGAGVGVEETKGVDDGASVADAATTTAKHSNVDEPLTMQWGVHVPIVTVAAVRDMAMKHCGLSRDTDIHQPLMLLHHMGCVVYGGARPVASHTHHAKSSRHRLAQLVVLDRHWLAHMLSRVVAQYDKHRDDSGTPVPPRGHVPLRDVALAWHGYPDEVRGIVLEVLFALGVVLPGRTVAGRAEEDVITVPALRLPANDTDPLAVALPSRNEH